VFTAALVLTTLAAVSCGSNDQAQPATANTVSSTTSAPTTQAQTTAAPTTVAPTTVPPITVVITSPPATSPPTMPDVVGLNLQEAQDRIQGGGVFYSRSVDCTGAGRMQVVDRNWVVVTQDPAPGVAISEGSAVLGVVKYGETLAC
jgi:beta-lactam-binding protein with PASTA domain